MNSRNYNNLFAFPQFGTAEQFSAERAGTESPEASAFLLAPTWPVERCSIGLHPRRCRAVPAMRPVRELGSLSSRCSKRSFPALVGTNALHQRPDVE